MRIAPMTPAYAADIVTWRYEPPYDCYDMTSASPALIADPASGFFALVGRDELIGFRSFGVDGQVPGGDYDDLALDTGGGLRPDLTGRGLGRLAVTTGLEFGCLEFAPPAFRVTVASFNERALRVVRSLGFRDVSRFRALTDGRSFEILVMKTADMMPGGPAGSR